MYILSLYTGHTATAALLKDGEIIACASEERFRNIKNYLGFPREAMWWCLEYAGIKPADLNLVVRCGLYGAPIHSADKASKTISALSLFYSLIGLIRQAWRRLSYYIPVLRPIGQFCYRFLTKSVGRLTVNNERRYIARLLDISADKIVTYEHHELHAAGAYYASPFNQKKALVLTLDAEGDFLCATVNIYNKEQSKRIASTSREHSLGWLFLYVTKYLGMKPMEHEYKVMGLAPYAKGAHVATVYNKIKDLVTLNPKNRLEFKAKFNTYDALYYLQKEMRGYRFDNIAGAFQKLLEERMVEWVKEAIKQTGIKTIIVSGGAFMNVKANQQILALPEVKEVFFMPSGGDESLPIGGCYLGYLQINKNRPKAAIKPITTLYWGEAYTDKAINDFLHKGSYYQKYKVSYHPSDVEKQIAKLLAKGQVVARFAGRMEWGARSLGNRAILAPADQADVVMTINEQMKDRDFWMPFAPSILEERINDYCVNPKDFYAPYMIVSFDSTPLARIELKAAMHPYDFTLRPQAVRKSWNESYYKVLKEFENLTGIGGVLNTSFNLHGLPIVRGPKEALYAFEHSGLEYLVLEHYLITKFK